MLAAIAVSAAALGTALYASRVAPRNVEVEEVALPLRHMGSAFDDYRIVQISDLHADRWMTPSRLRTLVEMVNAVEPDLVVVTGDLVTDPEVGRDPALAGALGALEARDGCLAVLGNYDYVAGEEVVRDLIAAAGITELDNDFVTLRRGGDALHVAGVDDVWQRRARLDLVLQKLPDDTAAILLAHEPDFADIAAASGRFGLQLSGHTHGGQVRLPLYGPVLRPPHGRRYDTGTRRAGGMLVHTNRGLGMFPPRLRLNCPPQISVLNLGTDGAGA